MFGRRSLWNLLSGACVVGMGATAVWAAPGSADTVLLNGRIHTPAGVRSALAIADGRIVAIGSDAQVLRRATTTTQRIDLAGRAVLPGMYDMHVHPMMAGNGAEGRCRIPQGATAAELLQQVAVCVRAEAPGDWVTGAQWQAVSMGATPVTRQTLDTVSPDNPVMLFDISGHSLWVNSKALQVAGITRQTADPEGGIIERSADGEPTGLLRETARDLIFRHLPAPTAAQNVQALRDSLQRLLSRGITGLVDAMVFRADLEAYDTLDSQGELFQTVRACLAYSHAGKPVAEFPALLVERERYARARLHPDCVKVFTDGVPTESHTAAMLEPYADAGADAAARGRLLIDAELLNRKVAEWDALGLTVLFHAAGDAAVRASLDAVAHARTQNGPGGPHHQVGHSTFVAPTDLSRARRLQATIEFSPYLWYPSPINDDIAHAIGPERMARAWPLREGLASGARVVAGSDWAVVPDPNPWIAIETAVTRRAPGGEGPAFAGGEALRLQQAIEVFTLNGARQLGLADRTGSLVVGKQADLIVLDRDPFATPVAQLHATEVLETWIGGRRVYVRDADVRDSRDPPSRAAEPPGSP